MTIGTATGARTKVRTTGERVLSQSPRATLMTVSVGNTQSQIMTASWCRAGGRGRGWRLAAVGEGSVGMGSVGMVLLGWVALAGVRAVGSPGGGLSEVSG